MSQRDFDVNYVSFSAYWNSLDIVADLLKYLLIGILNMRAIRIKNQYTHPNIC